VFKDEQFYSDEYLKTKQLAEQNFLNRLAEERQKLVKEKQLMKEPGFRL
jgi:hypothetical protein